MSDVLTVREVAARVDMAPETVYRMLGRGDFPIPALRIGSRWKFSRAQVDAYLSRPAGGPSWSSADTAPPAGPNPKEAS